MQIGILVDVFLDHYLAIVSVCVSLCVSTVYKHLQGLYYNLNISASFTLIILQDFKLTDFC